jgi:hypothetical protein
MELKRGKRYIRDGIEKGKRYMINKIITRVFAFILIITTLGCSGEEEIIIHYKFKNSVVSRYDNDKKSYFFYGNIDNTDKLIDGATIIVDWQFDDFLQSSLIFHENGTVEIMKNGVGEFSVIKKGGKMFFKEYESPEQNRITQKYYPPNRFHNFCRLSDNLEFEAKTNKEFGSDVTAEYILER